MSTPAATFRAKTNFMKTWKPVNPPSNRDRLELYALHKQSVSGDAPPDDPPDATLPDKAKLTAWRTKRGLSQPDAMQRYIDECDRQIRTHGTHDENDPIVEVVPLCPRGLAAVPLLCAAASESRSAYLSRLRATSTSNGWWSKQEPLCLESGNPLSIPERLIIGIAERVEKVSLVAGHVMGDGSVVSPRVIQAVLWPVHNTFLAIWILWILSCTYLGSVVMMSQTLLFGAKRTNTPLGRVFMEEVNPSARAAESLCEPHQTIGVRVTGLVLMPLMLLCDLSNSAVNRAGLLAGSGIFITTGLLTWWYWICVLPWLAFAAICLAVVSGWCFGVIELSGN